MLPGDYVRVVCEKYLIFSVYAELGMYKRWKSKVPEEKKFLVYSTFLCIQLLKAKIQSFLTSCYSFMDAKIFFDAITFGKKPHKSSMCKNWFWQVPYPAI